MAYNNHSCPNCITNQEPGKICLQTSQLCFDILLFQQKFGTDFELSHKECADSVAFIEMMKSRLLPAVVCTILYSSLPIKHDVRLWVCLWWSIFIPRVILLCLYEEFQPQKPRRLHITGPEPIIWKPQTKKRNSRPQPLKPQPPSHNKSGKNEYGM